MQPKVLLCTSLCEEKRYTIPLLQKVLPHLDGVAGVLIVADGIPFPQPLCKMATYMHILTALSPQSGICIHGRIARVREATRLQYMHYLPDSYTHIYWHDSDMVPDPDTIPRLLAHNAPVVSGLYPLRGQSETTTLAVCLSDEAQGEEEWDLVEMFEGTFPALAAGMGCMLVDRATVERVPFRPPDWYTAGGYGEDIRWGKDLGIPVLIDTNVRPYHVDEDGTGIRANLGVGS